MKIFNVLFIPLVIIFWTSSVLCGPLDGSFDSQVIKMLKDLELFPVYLLQLLKMGGKFFFKGYGTRKFGENLPITALTLSPIASNTKEFTAAAMAMPC